MFAPVRNEVTSGVNEKSEKLEQCMSSLPFSTDFWFIITYNREYFDAASIVARSTMNRFIPGISSDGLVMDYEFLLAEPRPMLIQRFQ